MGNHGFSSPSDARPFVWCVEHLISSLRNDCTLRDPGMARRCLHKVLACLHLGYQCKIYLIYV